MSDNRALFVMVIALSFVTGVAVGVAGTLLTQRAQSPSTATGATIATPVNPASAGVSANSPASPVSAQSTGVFINQRAVSPAQLDELKRTYGAAPPAGRYWYDSRSGLYGIWGHEAAGYIRPGHDFGAVPSEASAGNTGVFINGRQINLVEAQFIQRLFGAVYQGRWWLDGQTGNLGMDGNPTPIANVVVAMQNAQRSSGGGGGGYRWRDNINNASGGAENGCVWVNTPGSSYSSSGCN